CVQPVFSTACKAIGVNLMNINATHTRAALTVIFDGADDLLVSGDLSTLGNLYTQQGNENFVLSQVGVDVIAPSMAKDADAHTSVLSKFPSQRRQLINLSNK
ncbi:hypothetical protein Tco_1415838, partial [Tanacetum coccineum]